jgi:uncharacterized Tic20 family protein
MTSFPPQADPAHPANSGPHRRSAADASSQYPAGYPARHGRSADGQDGPGSQSASWVEPAFPPGSWVEPAAGPASWDEPAAPPASWDQPAAGPGSWDQPAAPPGSWDQPAAPPGSWEEPAAPPAGGWDGLAGQPEAAGGDWPEPAGDLPAQPPEISRPARDGDEAWAMIGYLGVPFMSILAPLTVYLVRARSSDYVRQHATQALNVSITLVLYNVCALILAGMLALDTIGTAVLIAVPLTVVLWLVTLSYLLRAAVQASMGGFYQLPRWLCATIAR